MVIIVG